MNPAVSVYRVANRFHRAGFSRVSWALSWLNRLIFSAWIPGSASIGRNFVCGYWGLGVVIHQEAVIGDDCIISQNVTIGRNGTKDGIPRLGNRVYVGSGAVIVGGVFVGDGAKIGANSVVLHDVEPGCVVVGAPAKPVSRV